MQARAAVRNHASNDADRLSPLVRVLVCFATGSALWGALAKSGAYLNLFNLLPLMGLDRARGFHALAKRDRIYVTGAFVLAWLLTHEGLLILLALVAPRVRDRRDRTTGSPHAVRDARVDRGADLADAHTDRARLGIRVKGLRSPQSAVEGPLIRTDVRSLSDLQGKVTRLIQRAQRRYIYAPSVLAPFANEHYNRHNQRRLEHLGSLGLPLHDRDVLEVGAGIGDHTTFFLDRGCKVVTSDAMPQNVRELRSRYPQLEVLQLDLDAELDLKTRFDIVYSYGLLYHLGEPARALATMARLTGSMLLLETCVSFGDSLATNLVVEDRNPTQAYNGTGCRPTRPWVMNELKKHFEHVYMPVTQPNHSEFPIDWSTPPPGTHAKSLFRSVFIASRNPLDNPLLVEGIPALQRRG
ncbi:MAG TPA: methyltransferase domain-containing protein [Polyangiales bacterium]|nr:methyltransferase domain-containing protein [Polyangiales bacterium]